MFTGKSGSAAGGECGCHSKRNAEHARFREEAFRRIQNCLTNQYLVIRKCKSLFARQNREEVFREWHKYISDIF
jgi:hypothetical protein